MSTVNLAGHEAAAFDLMVGGDFNGDGYGDLAAGSPRSRPGGRVGELLGSPTGINAARLHVFKQGAAGVPGRDEYGDFWGSTLTAGDLTGDGRDDLLVGNSDEPLQTIHFAGNVTLLLGGRNGLLHRGSTLWSQSSPDVCGVVAHDNRVGEAMTMGHFVDPERWDARISAPFDRTGGWLAGLLVTIHGGATPYPDGCTVGNHGEVLGANLIGGRT